MRFSLKIFVIVILFHELKFSSSKIIERGINDVMSDGIAQLIDFLAEQYQMRFTIVSTGYSERIKHLAIGIIKASKSSVKIKHSIEINSSNVIDFDESFIVLHENCYLFPDFIGMTKLLTYRRKLTLSFNMNYTDQRMVSDVANQQKFENLPHDYYMIAHSPLNGSLWLLGNQLFFNGTCEPHYHPINTFNSLKRNWNSSRFMNEYLNFNRCEVEIGEEDSLDGMSSHETRRKLIVYLKSIFATFAERYEITFNDNNFMSDLIFKDPKAFKINDTVKRKVMSTYL